MSTNQTPIPAPPPLQVFVGIDWAAVEHHVCLLRPDGRRLGHRVFKHTPLGLHQLVSWVEEKTMVAPELVGFAIETPNHPVVDLALDRGHRVFSLNPKQADRFRDRHTAAGSKDDRKDAYVHADALRTDQAKFRELAPPSPDGVRLKELSRRCDTLQEDLTRLTNRLWEALQDCAPQLLSLCPEAHIQPFFWDLLEAGLDPRKAKTLRPDKVERIVKRYHKRNVTAEQCLAALKGPRLVLLPGRLGALVATVDSLLPQLHVTHEQLAKAQKELAPLVQAQGEVAQILLSFKGIGPGIAATFLGEASHLLRAGGLPALRALCGTAPVSKNSGRTFDVTMRRACNRYLRNACQDWARTAVRDDPWARALYSAMTARGKTASRAYRGVADRLLTRLVACIRDGTLYDPSRGSLASASGPQGDPVP